ncbi:transcription antitermination factor NusB [Homoserinibacter sp. GY 40078]|uniref:transcription antitermination factor NusB n=1 Tax=Homoserinibacter sp. GY 40078 TaxID=2603275 RepID=UPI0011C91168|nr:transcription antitermination factor NusB [Homoserinibacter sp. GY 40078]TXK17540.1 transcription antitermination factor NusB [Homoserinibacter sp. GY 40078]
MSSRTKARKRALDVIYGADLRERSLTEALAEEELRATSYPERAGSWAYAREIVAGVDAHLDELDAVIEAHTNGWPLDRMPPVDRALIRIGAWEILHNDEVPDGVAIAEAVEAASQLSTDESGAFVNGVLSAIARGR